MMSTPQHHANRETIRLLRAARVIFWDFDGVIKDSVSAKSDGFEQLFLPYGEEMASRVRQHHEANGGVSRYEKIAIYLGWVGEPATEARIQEFCDHFSALVLQAVIDSPWVPGVREYLRDRYAQQRFVLLTATPQEEIQGILRTLDIAHCFEEVRGSPAKKATAMAEALRRMQCVPEDALMIGDSESDLSAARANSVAFLLRSASINQALQERYTGPTFERLTDE